MNPEVVGTAQSRSVRVFVSSTFRDMQAEREELIKVTFPQLRKLCEERHVAWGEVDLRWGVPDEQKAEGKVLPVCLEEIRNCRPYFIGLLGERYGWVPETMPQEMIDREPWLVEHKSHSVTELEILHGVLRNPEMAQHAIFYFRDQKASQKVEQELENQPDYIPEPEASRDKLQALKEKIQQSAFPVKEYTTPKSLGQLVLDDLTRIINELYPPESIPDPLTRETFDHDAFAVSRARVYISRKEYFDQLDAHAVGDGQPLVILGESGSGKSALLANWALKYHLQHPDDLLIMHFIGSSPYSADWQAMLRRIMEELKRKFGIEQEIPSKPDELRSAFANWLHMAAARGKAVIILDGLNQLEDRDQAPDLVWLPPYIPPNIRLLLSTLPGRSLDDLTKRVWPTLKVEALTPEERRQLIPIYLKQYTKALSSEWVDRIAEAQQTANPLYLKVLLEELRVFGIYEQLNQRIEHYLQAADVKELYRKVLARWEEDYDRDRPGLVREALSLIWAARRGLTETELLEMLGTSGEPLPAAVWSPLYLAARDALVTRSGLLDFFHDYLREAIWETYLPTEEHQKAAHLMVADYFVKQELGTRKVEELPWQQWQGGDDEGLLNSMCDVPLLVTAVRLSWLTDLADYWNHLQPMHNVVRTFVGLAKTEQARPNKAMTYMEYIEAAAMVLEQLGLYEDAENFFGERLRVVMQSGEPAVQLVGATNRLVEILLRQDKYKSAMKWLAEVYDSIRGDEQMQDPTLVEFLAIQAMVYTEKGYFEEADRILTRAEIQIQKSLNFPALAVGAVLQARAKLAVMAAAHGTDLGFFSESEAHGGDPQITAMRAHDFLREKLGCGHMITAVAQRDLARAYLMGRNHQPALEAASASVNSLEKLLGTGHPEVAKSLVGLADVYLEEGSFEKAEPLYKRAVQIFVTRNPETVEYSRALSRLALICRAKKQDPEAEQFEAAADEVTSAVKTKWGTMRPGIVASRTASRGAALKKTLMGGFSRFTRGIIALIVTLGPRGRKALELTIPVIAIISFTGLALFAFGPFARFQSALGVLEPFRLARAAVGHLCLLFAWMLGYNLFFKSLFDDEKSTPLRSNVITFASWCAYAAAFFLFRERWHLIPSTVTGAVVIVVGVLLVPTLIVSTLTQTSSRASSAVDERKTPWGLKAIFRLAPKSMRHAATLDTLGPRAETASASEALNVIFGSGVTASAIKLVPPEGLSVYARTEELPVPATVPGTLVKHPSRFDAWLAVRAGLVASLVMVATELATFLPEGFRPQREVAIKYGVLSLVVFYVPLGIRMARRFIPLGKTLAVVLPITVGASLAAVAIGKGLDGSILIEALDWIIRATLPLVTTYGITWAIIKGVSQMGVPQSLKPKVEKPRFSLVFGIISGIIAPAFILVARFGIRPFWPQGSASMWISATIFGICIFAFIALGFEIARRRLHLLRTLAIQCPLCFVAMTCVLLSGSEKGSGGAIAGGVLFVGLVSLAESVSWGISRRVLHSLKGERWR